MVFMKIPHLCYSIVRLAALSVVALSACAGETNSVPNLMPMNFLCAHSSCALKALSLDYHNRLVQSDQSGQLDSATNSDSNSGFSDQYSVSSYDPFQSDRQKWKRDFTLPEKDTVEFVGIKYPITQGMVPLNIDPMQTASERYLDDERYNRVELFGDGTKKGDVFISEANGIGINMPTKIARDAALYVRVADNGARAEYTSSFKNYPLEGLFGALVH
jgi:hypothetical protein